MTETTQETETFTPKDTPTPKLREYLEELHQAPGYSELHKRSIRIKIKAIEYVLESRGEAA